MVIGTIQKTLVECLMEAGGEALRAAVFQEARVPADRMYRMDRNYPDEEMARLIEATMRLTGLSPDEVHALFSRTFIGPVKEVFPQFIAMSASS